MNLADARERAVLRRHVLESVPADAQIVAHIDDYIRLFPWPDFHTVYQGGLIAITAPNNIHISADLRNMLLLTESLLKLERFQGFSSLMEGFRNPTQFLSTIFEVNVASWCSTRSVSRDIEFSPTVESRGHSKHPDFLWKTDLGDLYCECKRENSGDNKPVRRLMKLAGVIQQIYERNAPWDVATRVDVIVGHPALDGTPRVIDRLLSNAAQSCRINGGETSFVEDVVIVKLSKTTEELPDLAGCIQMHSRQLQAHCPEPAFSTNARFTVTMSVMQHRLKQLIELVKDARTQLPVDRPGGIFVDIGGSKIFVEKLHEMLNRPEYWNTPWISLWEGAQPMKAVIRGGQPFDGRLAAPAAMHATE